MFVMDTLLIFRMQRYDSWAVKLQSLVDAAESRAWRVQVIDQPAAAPAIRRLLNLLQPRGVVVIESPAHRFAREPFQGIPTVFMDCEWRLVPRGLPDVLHDTSAVCEAAIRTLLDIGCTNIGYVGWFEKKFWCADKLKTCRATLALLGRKCHEFLPSERESRDAALLNERLISWLRALPRPCGLITANRTIAELTLTAAAVADIDIPGDLAILSINSRTLDGNERTSSLSFMSLNYRTLSEKVLDLIEHPLSSVPSGPVLVKAFKYVQCRSTRRFPRRDREVEAAVELIHQRAAAGLKVSEVLDTFTCSRRSAELRFKVLTGHSIQEEILKVRHDRACELLQNGSLPVGTIADCCGYPSALVMCRQFKARTGTTPLKWRRSTQVSTNLPTN